MPYRPPLPGPVLRMNTGLSGILLRLIMTVRVRNVSAGLCRQDHMTAIAAGTQTATIQMTVSAKQNLAAVANLASNTFSQAGRLTLFFAFVFVFALSHKFCSFFMLYCKISTNNTINNTKGSHENRLAYDCPGNVMKLTSTQQCQYKLTHFRNIYSLID